VTNTAILSFSALLVLATAALTAFAHHDHAPVAIEARAARDAAGEAVAEDTAG
jgi:hypothetical protein